MNLNLVAFFLFISYSALSLKKSPVSSFLSTLIGSTYFLGLLVGNYPKNIDLYDLINFTIVVAVLLMFCHAFYRKRIVNIKEDLSLITATWFLLFFSILLFVVSITNTFIVYNSISYALEGDINITQYKNQGGAAEMVRVWADPRLVFLSYGFSPLAYFALPLHFYFILQKKTILSVLFLIFALNIPLVGLHALSRSSIVHFVFLYFVLYFACYNGFEDRLRKKFNTLIVCLFVLISIVFYLITESRFGSGYTFQNKGDNSIITNPILYSIFDYASQWIVNGNNVLRGFELSDIWFGKSSFTVFDVIKDLLGFETVDYNEVRQDILGKYSSKFIGLVATLVYDFSYIGMFFYVTIFALAVKVFVPSKSELKLGSFLILVIMVSQPLMFFTNNYVGNTMYAIGSFYGIIIYFLSKIRRELLI